MNINIEQRYIELETDELTDAMLDEIKDTILNYDISGPKYSDYPTLIAGEEVPGKSTFYDMMINHPRLEEFMRLEAGYFVNKFKATGTHIDNPRVFPRFMEILYDEIIKSSEDTGSWQEFEEFLDYRANVKSAKNA